jgi:hypothetical protein
LVVAAAVVGVLTLPLAAAADDGVADAVGSVETGDRLVGEVVQAIVDHRDDGGAGHTEEHEDDEAGRLTWVEGADGAVRVAAGELDGIPVGATVAVTVGTEVVDEAATEHGLEPAFELRAARVVGDTAQEPALAPAAAPGTTNSVTVAMVVPAGATPDTRTVESMVDTVNGPVSQFWSEQSRGAIRIGVSAAFGWTSLSAGCSDPAAMWRETAAKIGWVPGPGQHLMLYISSSPANLPGCAYGLAQVGSGPTSGGRLLVRDAAVSLIAHEMGHNFGLQHSAGLQCDGAVESGSCQVAAYRDYYDVMGTSWNQLGSLSVLQAATIGLLPPAEVAEVGSAGPPVAVALSPVSSPGGTRAVRLIAADGTDYWAEWRTPAGQDAWLANRTLNRPGLQDGIVLRRAADGADSSLLLDGSPSNSAGWAGDYAVVLPPGTPVTVGGFTLTVQPGGATGALLQVQRGGAGPGPTVVSTSGSVRLGSGDIGGTGANYLLNDTFSGKANRVFSFGGAADVVYSGDWDGVGGDTLAVRRGNQYFLRNSTSSGVADTVLTYGDPGDVVLVGDWDGNGTDTLAVRRGSQYFVKNSLSTGVADVVLTYGDPGDVVLVGDWDGDGDDSLTVRRGSQYFVKDTVTTGVADRTFVYGDPGDSILVGRWSSAQAGDTLAVRRGGIYHLRYSLSTGAADQVTAYGDAIDTAFAGDWNGDRLDTLGVRRG